ITTADIRSQFFLMIRYQKNAVLSFDDEKTREYAMKSELASVELVNLVQQLEGQVEASNMAFKAKALKDAVEKMSKLNAECLHSAKADTTAKANVILSKKIGPSIEKIGQIAVQSTSATPLPSDGAARPAPRPEEILRAAQIAFNALVQHVATPSLDPAFAAIDRSTRIKVDGFFELLNAFTDPSKTVEVEMKNISMGLRTDIDEFLAFSTTDSNGRSMKLSLEDIKDSVDTTLKILDEITAFGRSEADAAVKASDAIYSDSSCVLLGTSLIGLVLGCVASFFVSRSITVPVSLVRNLAQDMAKGNLMSRINLKQSDEVGELATATDSLANSLSEIVGRIQNASTDLSGSSIGLEGIAKSLVKQSEQTSARADSVSTASEQLSVNIHTMSSAAEEMSMNFASISSATEEMSVSVGSISSAAEQTSNNVAAVTTAIHDISISFEQVLNNVRDGSHVANNASQMANSATSTMKHLDQSSTEISKVTETIKMIALQTNLLALNATIEATSAGEAGKGFAVVAHEIKQLANQSAKAAEDIATKIEGVQKGTRQAVGVIQEIAAVIKEINASADRISNSVEEQNKAAQTISKNIAQANSGVGQIARSISEVAATANDMARNIAEATRGATDVSRNVGEAAKAASDISDSIGQVSKAALETNRSSENVTVASETLAQLSHDLQKLASRFKIPTNDA
ncbi:MAG: methyl-accepting chemotaxis protein, partial [Pirellula sp.]